MEDTMEDALEDIHFLFNEYGVKRSRISVKNYWSLLEILKESFDLDDDDDDTTYFTLVVIYKVNELEDVFRTDRYKIMTKKEILNAIMERINTLAQVFAHSFKDKNLFENIPIHCATLEKITTQIGAGKQKFEIDFYNGQMYKIYYPRSVKWCLIKCLENVYPKQIANVLKHLDRDSEKLKNTKSILNYIEKKLKTKNSSPKLNLIKTAKNFKDGFENIIVSGNHAGHVTKISDVDDILDIKKKYIEKKYPTITDIGIAFYDVEWEWEKQENTDTYIASDPKIICIKFKTPAGKIIEWTVGTVEKLFQKFEVMNLLTNKVYIYSHNGAGVEHQIVVKEMIKQNPMKTLTFTNISGTKIKTFKYKNLEFRDSNLFIPLSIEKIAKVFNLDKKLTGHIPDYITKKWDVNDPGDVEYCMRDVEIGFDAITKFNTYVSGLLGVCDNSWLLSTGSLSSIIKDHIIKNNPQILNTFPEQRIYLQGYFGGRCECFKVGVFNDIKAIDINSSYPHQMTKGLPSNLISVTKEIPTKNNHIIWGGLVSLSNNKKVRYPLLPIKKDFKLLFPNFVNPNNVWLWDFQYEELLKDNNITIHNVSQIFVFEKFTLAPLITKLYNERLRVGKDTSTGTVCKFLMNSAYGALALKLDRNRKTIYNKKSDDYLKRTQMSGFETEIDMGTHVAIIDTVRAKADTATHVSAYITALAQFQLYQKIIELEKLGCDVLYTDTDSVYFVDRNNAYLKSNESKLLGGWDYKEFKSIDIRAPKLYSITEYETDEQTIHYKGVNKPKNLDKDQYTESWFRSGKLEIGLKRYVKISTQTISKGTVINNDVIPFDL